MKIKSYQDGIHKIPVTSTQSRRFPIQDQQVSDWQEYDEEINLKMGYLNMLTRMYWIGRWQHHSKSSPRPSSHEPFIINMKKLEQVTNQNNMQDAT